MSDWLQRAILIALVAGLAAVSGNVAQGQEGPAGEATTEATAGSPTEAASDVTAEVDLSARQERIARDYERLQQALLKMAEVTASSDPRRADLLRKTYARGSELAIDAKLAQLAEMLANNQLYEARQTQGELQVELQQLLELLLTGQQEDRLSDEKERLAAMVKQLNGLIRLQRSIHGQTANNAEAAELAKRQAELAEAAAKLKGELPNDEQEDETPDGDEPNDNAANPSGDGEQQGPPDKKKPPQGGTPSDETPEGTPAGEPMPGQNKKPPNGGEAQPSDEGEPSETPESEGEAAPPAPQQPPTARQRVASAEDRMRRAQRRLEAAEKDPALREQERAIEELEIAKAELERVLRQLREEEIEQVLTMLETRFRKMLALQTEVLEGTERLTAVPKADRDRGHAIEAGRLGRTELELVTEADRALALMREEGTAVALPEALGQLRVDMQQIADLLGRADVSPLTVSLERDVASGLEELIAAVQRAKEEHRNAPPPGQPGAPSGSPGESPLVDQLAELRMIRALQTRVQRRTVEYNKLLADAKTDRTTVETGLRELAARQERIYEITRDIVTGRNQ